MNKKISEKFKPFLWSFDIEKMDPDRDKNRIIINVLNLGSKEATDELFREYDIEIIKELVRNPKPGEWNKKSLNYWSIIFDLKPKHVLRHFR